MNKCPYLKPHNYCQYMDNKCNPSSIRCRNNCKPSMFSHVAPYSKSNSINIRGQKKWNKNIPTFATNLRTVDLSKTIPTLYVYSGHLLKETEDVRVRISLIGDEQKADILCAYNRKSRKYYIFKDHLNYYVNSRKLILRVKFGETGRSEATEPFQHSMYEMNEISILKLYGYSVGKTNGLPQIQRHSIIDYILDNKIAKAHELVSLIEFFVSMRENQSMDYSQCIKEWKGDIVYICKKAKIKKNETISIFSKKIANITDSKDTLRVVSEMNEVLSYYSVPDKN